MTHFKSEESELEVMDRGVEQPSRVIETCEPGSSSFMGLKTNVCLPEKVLLPGELLEFFLLSLFMSET
jgi:hypothetical protein